jgi:hypothetical protein
VAIPIAAISAGLGVANKIFGKGGKKRGDLRRAIATLRATRPEGYLTPADMRAAELTRGRLTEGVSSAARQEGYEIGRRSQARGLAGSPSEERARARLENQRLLGVQRAGESSEEQLYNIKTGREAFERQKALEIFGAEAGRADQEYARAQAEEGAFWNSLNEFMPTIIGGLGGGQTNDPNAAASPTGAYTPRRTGYNPETQANPETYLRRKAIY